MKFDFIKYKFKRMIVQIIIVILLLGIFNFYALDIFSIIYFSLFITIIIIIEILRYYYLMISFFRHHSKEKIKQFEEELSNTLLKYDSCFLTENYIFDVETFEYIKYEDIICITPNLSAIILNGKKLRIGEKQMIYLKNNKKYVIKSFNGNTQKFVKLIKKKNNDAFIGDIKEYEKQKQQLKYIKEIKRKTKI